MSRAHRENRPATGNPGRQTIANDLFLRQTNPACFPPAFNDSTCTHFPPQIKPPLALTAHNPCCDERREGLDCQKHFLSPARHFSEEVRCNAYSPSDRKSVA